MPVPSISDANRSSPHEIAYLGMNSHSTIHAPLAHLQHQASLARISSDDIPQGDCSLAGLGHCTFLENSVETWGWDELNVCAGRTQYAPTYIADFASTIGPTQISASNTLNDCEDHLASMVSPHGLSAFGFMEPSQDSPSLNFQGEAQTRARDRGYEKFVGSAPPSHYDPPYSDTQSAGVRQVDYEAMSNGTYPPLDAEAPYSYSTTPPETAPPFISWF
ncbi:hypothetical protein NMY22_g1955 [Coprinellus aureogranulatus]|nr:hypothetical protein NMY22_g1955 [Coprinellus aureogranulatus]